MAAEIKKRLRVDEVWEAAGYSSKAAFLKDCQRKVIPHIRVSPRKVLIDPDDFNEFLDSKKVEVIVNPHFARIRGINGQPTKRSKKIASGSSGL